ncbi:MAG TPA: hypothetical protein VF472_17195 [Burkholderiaceae bacterium]
MAGSLDTHNLDAVAGAVYFVVGRGTEGGSASYHLSIAGVTERGAHPTWGNVDSVRDNSGYSLGTIQVDLGQRGTWPLGAVADARLKPGETTYVDGVIDQAAKYAKEHGLKFTEDREKLRADLLSHGHQQQFSGTGKHRHAVEGTPLQFIDQDTRNSIDAWASSSEGQQWIHKNIDFPQIRNATQSAMDMLDKYGQNISEDHRLETIAILAKTANQRPGDMKKFEEVLKHGGDYDAVHAKAEEIKATHQAYDGLKAATIAGMYKNAALDPEKAAALERAQAKVSNEHFDPSKSANDPDINAALNAIHPARQHPSHAQHHDAHAKHHTDHTKHHADHAKHHADHAKHHDDHGKHHNEHPSGHHKPHHGNAPHEGTRHADTAPPHAQDRAKTGALTLESASALPANAGRKETTDHLLAALLSDDPAVMHAGISAGLNTHVSQQNLQEARQTVAQTELVKQPAQNQPAPPQVQGPVMKMG